MTFTDAGFYGMGLVVLYGLVALIVAAMHRPAADKSEHKPRLPAH